MRWIKTGFQLTFRMFSPQSSHTGTLSPFANLSPARYSAFRRSHVTRWLLNSPKPQIPLRLDEPERRRVDVEHLNLLPRLILDEIGEVQPQVGAVHVVHGQRGDVVQVVHRVRRVGGDEDEVPGFLNHLVHGRIRQERVTGQVDVEGPETGSAR